ncbi:hypothetical protein ACOSQ4_022166 [Xanthoceras sorbifolium]
MVKATSGGTYARRQKMHLAHHLHDFQKANEKVPVQPGRIGMGQMNRNARGNVMAAGSVSMNARYSPQIAEATVLLHGLRLASDSGLGPQTSDYRV